MHKKNYMHVAAVCYLWPQSFTQTSVALACLVYFIASVCVFVILLPVHSFRI